jgi:deoxyadenosine/deoxycytidine kinase
MVNTIISIEGNIGSGKSTIFDKLSEMLKDDKRFVFLPEPVKLWETIKDREGMNILQNFYKDNEKYGFSFQMLACITIYDSLKKRMEENPDAIIISERSLFTTKLVFGQMLYDASKIDDIDFQIYKLWFDVFAKDYKINKIIYVNTEPSTCVKRIIKRNRHGENNISIDYLNKCDLYHKQMLESNICDTILEINGNIDIYENKDQLNNWINDIINFI